MPRKQASKKALRVTERRTARNRGVKSQLKDAIRKVRSAAAAKKVDDAKKALATAISKLDRAAKARVVPAARASRLKSRLTLLVNKSGK